MFGPPGDYRVAYERAIFCDRYLSEEAAVSGLPHQFRDFARTAWHFLDNAGYINFGVAPDILERNRLRGEALGTVIIVGAGLAGRPHRDAQNTISLGI